ncbi:MAG: hypothetical protein LBU23_00190, partial [Planctomycetota bacterium]|nr:hypothetical protein [Planctomycetota bacterium]
MRTTRTIKPGLAAAILCLVAGIAAVWALLSGMGTTASGGAAEHLRFGEMYSGASSLGIRLSDKLRRLEGKRVRMTGFMAPP